ncbi:hypothetical protein [Streptomyces himalayensis]|uniref:Uncharacterized protein n=1 Tax=Streptomyces himalayensis subsp. himalayensis TaxID=2756131 RepID=A0A7W0IDT8_9ACTN|nr:hypothetical protein [Streptomyces himalayensis]MBA2951589.1 hypothetical protein [Streptomyces himalayensis subsp. himalayensis]
MATSRVPAAVDALLTILRAASALAGVRIVDGPESVNVTDRRRIHIGWQPGADAAVGLTQDFASAGARTRDEDFEIACYAETRSGDKDMALQRTAVFELVGAVEDALRATDSAPTAPTLNGTVLWAHLTTGNLQQVQAEGAVAGLAFTITCRARI